MIPSIVSLEVFPFLESANSTILNNKSTGPVNIGKQSQGSGAEIISSTGKIDFFGKTVEEIFTGLMSVNNKTTLQKTSCNDVFQKFVRTNICGRT